MPIAEHRALLRYLIVERRALGAQSAQKVLPYGSIHIRLQIALRLLVTGIGLFGAQPGRGHLLIQFGHTQLLRRAIAACIDDLVIQPHLRMLSIDRSMTSDGY